MNESKADAKLIPPRMVTHKTTSLQFNNDLILRIARGSILFPMLFLFITQWGAGRYSNFWRVLNCLS